MYLPQIAKSANKVEVSGHGENEYTRVQVTYNTHGAQKYVYMLLTLIFGHIAHVSRAFQVCITLGPRCFKKPTLMQEASEPQIKPS